jgi:hypothetical protein
VEIRLLLGFNDRLQIFFQCPHRCSNPVDLGDGLTRLMLAGGHGHPRGIVGKVQRLVPSIIDVNGSFIGTNLLTKVTMVNVVSTVGDSSQRVSRSLQFGS